MEETTVLIAQALAGEKRAREVLVEKNLGLVRHIVKRFQGRGYEPEDLFQIGSIGLIKAIDKFDLSYDVKFSTYAVPMIMGEIKRFLRDDGMVKVSRTLKENAVRINQAAETIWKEKGKEPTLEEISRRTGIPAEEIPEAIEAGCEVESIYKSVSLGDAKEVCLMDRLPDKRDENEKLLNHMLLQQLMAELTKEERDLIEMRYFKEKTQTEVAKELGVSQVQVSRMEKKILTRMRKNVV